MLHVGNTEMFYLKHKNCYHRRRPVSLLRHIGPPHDDALPHTSELLKQFLKLEVYRLQKSTILSRSSPESLDRSCLRYKSRQALD